MANRFCIAAGGNSNASATWDATSSGGAGGSGVPTGHNAYCDSGSGNLVVNAGMSCLSFNCTGYTGTLSGSSTIALGSGAGASSDNYFTLVPGMTSTWSGTLQITTPTGAPANRKVTFGGKTFAALVVNAVSPNGVQLQDALSITGTLTVSTGVLDTNSQTVTCSTVQASAGTRTLTITNSTVTLTGTGSVWNMGVGGATLTLNASGSTIVVSNSSGTSKTFAGGGKTYNNLTINSGTGTVTITGNNTFNALSCAAPLTLTGTTQTCTAATLTGCTAILNGTLSVASGTVTAPSGCTITGNTASGGATFDATSATDGGGNSGWTFASASANTALSFGGGF